MTKINKTRFQIDRIADFIFDYFAKFWESPRNDWRGGIIGMFLENFKRNVKVITFSEINEPTHDRNTIQSSFTAKLKQTRNV